MTWKEIPIMKTLMGLTGALFLAFAGTAGAVQEEKEKDWKPEMPAEEQEMTPEEAMKLLKEAQTLMGRSAELLQDSSRGKALETDRELLEKIEKLLGEEDNEEKTPTSMQGKVLKLIRNLLRKSEKKQQNSLEKIKEVIRRAKACQSGKCKPCEERQKKQGKKKGQKQANRPQNPGSPAQKPYDPNRTDPPSKFRSRGDRTGRWGDLPPRVRDAILDAARDIDEYPPEYQEMIKEYMKRLVEDR
jgi:hypothetical protein